MPDPLLDVNQVAELLGTTPRFARRLVAERRIEFIKIGRHVRVRPAVVAEYLEANTVLPVSVRRASLRRAA
ncbi:helix-turn-helix domain-containing protein [Kitasatospora sp. NPDC059973]|uniref:helix-turn-helix domain-containing protein n=1 Tax=Kitasatospora sp. NPDC059973 TaxID=3347020 RepID=UPI00368AD76C